MVATQKNSIAPWMHLIFFETGQEPLIFIGLGGEKGLAETQ
jgi:hypothetical protein